LKDFVAFKAVKAVVGLTSPSTPLNSSKHVLAHHLLPSTTLISRPPLTTHPRGQSNETSDEGYATAESMTVALEQAE
jgi:hypothetical protein